MDELENVDAVGRLRIAAHWHVVMDDQGMANAIVYVPGFPGAF
jgi:hypothetical protein